MNTLTHSLTSDHSLSLSSDSIAANRAQGRGSPSGVVSVTPPHGVPRAIAPSSVNCDAAHAPLRDAHGQSGIVIPAADLPADRRANVAHYERSPATKGGDANAPAYAFIPSPSPPSYSSSYGGRGSSSMPPVVKDYSAAFAELAGSHCFGGAGVGVPAQHVFQQDVRSVGNAEKKGKWSLSRWRK